MADHPHLPKEVNDNIAKSEFLGGKFIKDIGPESSLQVRTRSRLYNILRDKDGQLWISGHPEYCPVPTPCTIAGSTWRGSMIKVGFLGIGMHMEFYTDNNRGRKITTTAIEEII